jgi:hypothetical protein
MKNIFPLKAVAKRRIIIVPITNTGQFNHGNDKLSQSPPLQDWPGRKKNKDLFTELS